MLSNGNDTVNPAQIAKAIILKDQRGMLMAVLPGPNTLNVEALNRQLHRNLQPASHDDVQNIFTDCEPGALPPLGEAYGLEAVVDDGLLDQDLIYFVSGNSRELIRISGYDFQLLQSNAWFGNIFSHASQHEEPQAGDEQAEVISVNRDLKLQLQQPEQTPNLPAISLKINQLNNNPYAHGEDLAKLLEKDPALSSQIIKYAQTNPFVKDTSVATIHQVMSRSLSYDLVMNLALGVSATRVFKLVPHGPLGLQAFWRHAAYSATLIYGLCQIIPKKYYLQPGTAVLCGLAHNIGLLLFGHRFAEEFTELNNAVSNTPDTAVTDIEQHMFGITHTDMGHWLTDYWLMPDELVTVTREHHNSDYQGPHQDYVRLVCLTDKLLKQHGIGDAADAEISDELLQQLGLTRQQVLPVLEKTIQGGEQLDHMARQLAA